MPALLDGVMQGAISAGSEQVGRQLSGGTITEQRGDGETITKAPLQTTRLPRVATQQIRL